jgi:hypothetical protein
MRVTCQSLINFRLSQSPDRLLRHGVALWLSYVITTVRIRMEQQPSTSLDLYAMMQREPSQRDRSVPHSRDRASFDQLDKPTAQNPIGPSILPSSWPLTSSRLLERCCCASWSVIEQLPRYSRQFLSRAAKSLFRLVFFSLRIYSLSFSVLFELPLSSDIGRKQHDQAEAGAAATAAPPK